MRKGGVPARPILDTLQQSLRIAAGDGQVDIAEGDSAPHGIGEVLQSSGQVAEGVAVAYRIFRVADAGDLAGGIQRIGRDEAFRRILDQVVEVVLRDGREVAADIMLLAVYLRINMIRHL